VHLLDNEATLKFLTFTHYALCLQCFDAVAWAAGRASGLQKTDLAKLDMSHLATNQLPERV